MKIVLGSTNNDKKHILENALKLYFNEFEIFGVETDSGISSQPLTEKETIQGAKNRANSSLKIHKDVDFAVGLEGGLEEIDNHGYYLVCIACIKNIEGKESIGISSKLKLPKEVSNAIKNNEQFGVAIRNYLIDSKEEEKEIIQMLIDRKELFTEAIKRALQNMNAQVF